MTLHDVYNVDGLLKKHFKDYQVREGQVKMSELIERALLEHSSAVIEGSTGVGKGLAYLIPIILANEKVIVSTSNKSLQDQLDKKDLPAIEQALTMGISWSVLKGRSNYFCTERFRFNEQEIMVELLTKVDGSDKEIDKARLTVQQIHEWVDEDEIGDMEYCPIEITSKAKELMCCEKSAAHEKDTEAAKTCYANKARERAMSSQIVLVNHTLLALDMNLRRETGGKVKFLPETRVVVIDEAHEFEKAAVLAFSDEISIYSLLHLLNWQLVKKTLPQAKRNALLNALEGVLNAYLPKKGTTGYYLETQVPYFKGLERVGEGLDDLIHSFSTLLAKANDRTALMIKQIVKEAETFKERLKEIGKEDTDMLRWSEAKDNARGVPIVKLRTVPLDISPLIKEGLFGSGKIAIATSATLAISGSFAYFKEQLGMPLSTLELIVPSPFDYKEQALVYVSDGTQDKYFEMNELLRMSKGRAFILFCSYKDMAEGYRMVRTDHPKLIQTYQQPRAQLLEEFKNTPNAILFATKSFWEGVDIKGDKLSLVIIPKIPFENPGNLVFKAKCDRLDKKLGEKKSFAKLYIPDACLKLKQGVGRLIRSAEDRGVIALLDQRVNTKSYGKIIIQTLPPAYRTQQLEKVEKFFAKINS